MQNYFSTVKSSELTKLLQLIANANLKKNPAKFLISENEESKRIQIVKELQNSGLNLEYNPQNQELSTENNHTARVLLKKGFPLITWNYAATWRPLVRSEQSPTREDLAQIAKNQNLTLEEKEIHSKSGKITRNIPVVYSANEKTTQKLLTEYGFCDLENYED